MKAKKLFALTLCVLLLLTTTLAGCDSQPAPQQENPLSTSLAVVGSVPEPANNPTPTLETAKYVFLFIGDGMAYPQINTAEILAQKLEDPSQIGIKKTEFTQFPYAGSVTTYDAESFCPDSASTGTAMASGNKTLGGVINMDVSKTEKFTIVSELAKNKGYKIGVISSVSLDHATPACFYAKQASRGDYYDIGLQLVNSGYDFFGGGGFVQPTGKEKDKESLIDIAKKNGFTVPETKEDILALGASSGPVLAINPVLADASAMLYEIDRINQAPDSLSLAQFVQKGIDVLDNDNGFFLMTEGGKVDWSCHANDAAAAMHDVLALNDAVKVALSFAEQHPDETLIIVTGDHETGGLTIGFAATGYSTFFEKTLAQSMSFIKFDELVKDMRENQTSFDEAFSDINKYFGLIAPDAPEASDDKNAGMVLTDVEYQKLKDAYGLSMKPADERNLDENQEILYGTYEPLSVTCTHILNNKAGIGWTSYSHTGVPIPVFATGIGAENFMGSYDNTDIFHKLTQVMQLV